jgi:NAD(P)H dehydrogenase (quinone)
MIFVTGAAGKTGQAVLQSLVQKGVRATALVRSQQQADSLQPFGDINIVIGDLRNPVSFEPILQKCESLYYICPNISPDELEIGRSLISKCQRYNLRRFVYHSVLHPQAETMPHHWQKLRMEEALLESGLDFTILQPCAYMQNILTGWQKVTQGEYIVPYQNQTRISMVDLQDVGEVASRVLTEHGHENAIYELSGPEQLSQADAAHQMSEVLGFPVQAIEQPRSEWEYNVRLAGMPELQIETLLKMFEYYNNFGLIGNPNTLEYLLGRSPTNFKQFLVRILASGDE